MFVVKVRQLSHDLLNARRADKNPTYPTLASEVKCSARQGSNSLPFVVDTVKVSSESRSRPYMPV